MYLNHGTTASILPPFTEKDALGTEEYQALTCIVRYQNYSFEELRLVDYNQGKVATFPRSGIHSTIYLPSARFADPGGPPHMRTNLQWLQGEAIEVVVGPGTYDLAKTGGKDVHTWCLPKALLAQASDFFKIACYGDFKEKHERRIVLADDDPHIFALFVEWLYYGHYSLQVFSSFAASFNGYAWVLGDKLLAYGFQNYVMGRLHCCYKLAPLISGRLSTEDVDYVCRSTVPGSKLRLLYFDMLITHFNNANVIRSTAAEWDKVLQDHADARHHLLSELKLPENRRNILKPVQAYMTSKLTLGSGQT